MKQNNKEVKISYWAAHLTTVVSVTLVLLILGIIALITVSASTETRRLRERIELSAIMADSVSDTSAQQLAAKIRQQPYAANVRVITREQALKNWTADTGEDLQALFGVNPLSPEVSFSLKADYASPAKIAQISAQLSQEPGVETVAAPDTEMVAGMNRNIRTLAIILGVIALVMVIISFVLINNTVHLTVYSRRFTIHTMQLVGATNGFIRRPFVINNMLAGVMSGLVATLLLACVIMLSPWFGLEGLGELVPWGVFLCIAGGLVTVGAAICAGSASIATTRYLRKDYDELFK